MRKRELFLQNSLATGASLLYRVSQALPLEDRAIRCLLKVEIEAWFIEMRHSLSVELSREPPEDIDTSAKPVEKSLPGWNSPREGNIPSSASPVRNTEPNTKPEEVSSNPSCGGMPGPAPTSLKRGENSPPNSADMNFWLGQIKS